MPVFLPSKTGSLVSPSRARLRRSRKPVCSLLGLSAFGTTAPAPDFSDTPPPSSTGRTVGSSEDAAPPPRQVPFCQQQPLIPRVLHQPATRLYQALLQARQRPRVDPLRQ